MRSFRNSMLVLGAAVFAAAIVNASPAAARCYTFEESHNGTDMFYPGGAAGTARSKLMESIEVWRQRKGIAKVRIGKVRTRCDKWNTDYILPHHRCYARARVCY